jgi:EF hand
MRTVVTSFLLSGTVFAPMLLTGCNESMPARVRPPVVDSVAASRRAMDEYDKDHNGQLSEAELKACPAIHDRRDRYDTNGDGEVSAAELSAYIEKMYARGAGLVEVNCVVLRNGKPLSEAEVEFVPEDFLNGAIQPATATTDARGAAKPAIAVDQLPPNLRNLRMMQIGMYRVQITHPKLPPHSVGPLGFEVNSSVADGASAKFNL